MTYYTGDTIQPVATFRALAIAPAVGALTDPDTVEVTIYDAGEAVLEEGAAIQESTGVYHYDWTLPLEPGKYTIEFKGDMDSLPTVIRHTVQVKFKF